MNEQNIREVFGKRVRELRLSKGLSQENLAEKSSLHRTYVGAIERGEQNISIDNISKLATALDVSLEHLFRGI